MKLALKLFLSLLALLLLEGESFSLTNYQIIQICKNEKRPSTCKKNLQKKRYQILGVSL